MERLTAALNSAGHYLEYGAGGSTKLAARTTSLSSITTVESDPGYVAEHVGCDPAVESAIRSGRLRFMFADIGPTGMWGHPSDYSKAHLWPTYALGPCLHGYRPDLILIDGRFRVACGLLAVLHFPEATIFIHDYTLRRAYRVLERYLTIEETIDTLVRCRARPDFDARSAQRRLRFYLYSPGDHNYWRFMLRRYARPLQRKLSSP